MAEASPASQGSTVPPTTGQPAPEVRIELRRGNHPAVFYEVSDEGFLIGSVPGCDLRLSGTNLPPVICLISRGPAGAAIRRLSPAYPILVNGQSLAAAHLADADCVIVGASEFKVHVHPVESSQSGPAGLAATAAVADPAAEAEPQQLALLRQQLYSSYRERSDRLAGLQQAVAVAARKVQERKSQLEAELQQFAAAQRDEAGRLSELHTRAEDLERERQSLDQQRQLIEDRREECLSRERQLELEQQALAARRAEYQEDLVRLDRSRASLELREQRLSERADEIDKRDEQCVRARHEQEEQERQLHEWHVRMGAEADRLAEQRAKQEAVTSQLTERVAALEGQQASLTSLRARLEQMREELRREAQQLTGQRARQSEAETILHEQAVEVQKLRVAVDGEKQRFDMESRRLEEAGVSLRDTSEQYQRLLATVAVEEQRLRLRARELDSQEIKLAEDAELWRAKSEQLMEMQERLAKDRQQLRQRDSHLYQSEHARESLQEQLRRRAEELAERQQALAELAQQRAQELAALETRRVELEREHNHVQAQVAQRHSELAEKSANLDQCSHDVTLREEQLHSHAERLRAAGRNAARARKSWAQRCTIWEATRREREAAIAQAYAEIDAVRDEVTQQQRLLPELELRAQSAAERLAAAREQLRAHLEELHSFAGQKHADLEALRGQVCEESDRVRQHVLALYRAREEHRLAVAGFRQQLIAWQGQVADLKQTLARDETRLEWRQTAVDEAARAADATSARLAHHAEELQQQEQAVAERRDEMDRHLADMRDWYRRKLRELAAGRNLESPATKNPDGDNRTEASASAAASAAAPQELPQPAHGILALTAEVDPGDRHLGDLLRSLGLVDEDTLSALLVEARRQRRSLRQILLASGYVTLYQLALIEADNLGALMLGPVRVVDRLRVTPHETVYRVFDPRRGHESAGPNSAIAVLRHLAESEMQDAVRPDEYRQRFAAAAAVQHPHIAATFEVLEIMGRPAALQEWVVGLAATDWSEWIGAPGVCYRLLCQAALGMQTAHQAGLLHGHLHPGLLVLTGEGILKLCGFGEPSWLIEAPAAEQAASGAAIEYAPVPRLGDGSAEDDLAALGRMVADWLAPARKAKWLKAKQAAKPLLPIVERLTADAPASRYPTAAALLEDLDRIGPDVPPNAEAWERLLRHVREHETGSVLLRRSA